MAVRYSKLYRRGVDKEVPKKRVRKKVRAASERVNTFVDKRVGKKYKKKVKAKVNPKKKRIIIDPVTGKRLSSHKIGMEHLPATDQLGISPEQYRANPALRLLRDKYYSTTTAAGREFYKKKILKMKAKAVDIAKKKKPR